MAQHQTTLNLSESMVARQSKELRLLTMLSWKNLARRTYDESGNYTVKPFTFVSKDYSDVFSPDDETKFIGVLSPGKAYVNGYEFETIANSNLIFDKARETTNIDRLSDTPEVHSSKFLMPAILVTNLLKH